MSPAAGARRSRGSIKDRAGSSGETKGQRTTCKRPWEKSPVHTKALTLQTQRLPWLPQQAWPQGETAPCLPQGWHHSQGPSTWPCASKSHRATSLACTESPQMLLFFFFFSFPSHSLKASAPQVTHTKKKHGAALPSALWWHCTRASPLISAPQKSLRAAAGSPQTRTDVLNPAESVPPHLHDPFVPEEKGKRRAVRQVCGLL